MGLCTNSVGIVTLAAVLEVARRAQARAGSRAAGSCSSPRRRSRGRTPSRRRAERLAEEEPLRREALDVRCHDLVAVGLDVAPGVVRMEVDDVRRGHPSLSRQRRRGGLQHRRNDRKRVCSCQDAVRRRPLASPRMATLHSVAPGVTTPRMGSATRTSRRRPLARTPNLGVLTLTALRCANCGLAYLGATVEHVLLLASSGASCPSCRTPLTEEPTATPVRRRRIALSRDRAAAGAERHSPQPT